MIRSADISACGSYRYALYREWDDNDRRVCFIMLNPSTADAEVDDPTIRRCIGFAKRWGFGSLEVVNLFALRATSPDVLLTHPRPIGPDTDSVIEAALSDADLTICAWGTRGTLLDRNKVVLELLDGHGIERYALRLTNDGHPAHPLYLPGNLKPVRIP